MERSGDYVMVVVFVVGVVQVVKKGGLMMVLSGTVVSGGTCGERSGAGGG